MESEAPEGEEESRVTMKPAEFEVLVQCCGAGRWDWKCSSRLLWDQVG